MQTLTLAERLVLISLDPATGSRRHATQIKFCAAGAVLAELALGGHLELVDKRVHAVSTELTGEPQLTSALRAIGDSRPRRPQSWVQRLGRTASNEALAALVSSGHVGEQTARVLGLFPVRRHPVLATGIVRADVENLHALLVGASPRAADDVELARLLVTAGLLKQVFPGVARGDAKARLAALGGVAWVDQAVKRAIEDQKAAAG